MNTLTFSTSKNNYYSFLWHAVFLALANSFMDVDTVLPTMMLEAGGTAVHVGVITAIMIGGPKITQLVFSPLLNNKSVKKPYLLTGIGARTASLFGMGILFANLHALGSGMAITFIFILLTAFAFGGAFAAISYTDILGKSMKQESRKAFFSIKQSVNNVGVLVSAYLVGVILRTIEYPSNYSWLFVIAGIALAIASLGFFRIKEVIVEIHKLKGVSGFLSALKTEVRSNQKLKYYIFMVNTLGISLSILPFVMMYVKGQSDGSESLVGQFLMLKVASSLAIGFLMFWLSKKIGYSLIMYLTAGVGMLMIVLLLTGLASAWFGMLFLLGGIMITIYKIATDGVLMEVSSDHNRSLYVGISGIGNVIPTVFPIIGGTVAQMFGFEVLFGFLAILLVLAIYFIYRLDCQK